MDTDPLKLTENTRKALRVHLGEAAGQEVDRLLRNLVARIEQLERSKVDITPIVPVGKATG